MSLSFVKMHGAGNDYIYVDATRQKIPDNLPELARRISDRHFGVGGDGLIVILAPEPGVDAHVRMRMWNNDGSEAEMCGNGIRCVAKLAWDDAIARNNPLKVQTGAGVLEIQMEIGADGKVESATVDMGEPLLEFERIPVDAAKVLPVRGGSVEAGKEVMVDSVGLWNVTLVSMGNPHAVIYANELNKNLLLAAPLLESHAAFPRKVNVHFVQVLSPREVSVLHWERGTGATLACGTGACAVCVAGVLTGRTEREILAHVPGGELRLKWDAQTRHVFKTGNAVEVFRGVWSG